LLQEFGGALGDVEGGLGHGRIVVSRSMNSVGWVISIVRA
jgi:hypothetical protein